MYCNGLLESCPFEVNYGVPQGSFPGPIFSVMYIRPLAKLLNDHGLYHAINMQMIHKSTTLTHCDIKGLKLLEKNRPCSMQIKKWIKAKDTEIE